MLIFVSCAWARKIDCENTGPISSHQQRSSTSIELSDRLMDAISSHRQPEHARPGCDKDRVGNHRCSSCDRRISTALRRQIVILDKHDLDSRNPGEARDVVGVEIPVKNLTAKETKLLGQCISETHGNPPFNLHLCALGIHDDPHVLCADNPDYFHASIRWR